MALALEEARAAVHHGDVPIGAVLVDRAGTVVGRGRNRREVDNDPSAHAEIVALREAGQLRGQWRLSDLTMVVTLEPCPMCAGALLAARVERVIYACTDPKAGAIDSLFVMGRDPRLNHRFEVVRGVLAEPCAELLRGFFSERRRAREP